MQTAIAIVSGYYHYSQIASLHLERYDSNNYRFEKVKIKPGERPLAKAGSVFKDEWIHVSEDGIGSLVEGESYKDHMDFSRLSHNSHL